MGQDRDPYGRGHSTNHVGVPSGLIGSVAFNDYPLPLQISAIRETNRSFFRQLAEAESVSQSETIFADYMNVAFGLDETIPAALPRRFRSSYLRLLKGWGYDANSREGAVLKGWVESRFGLLPTFHHTPLDRYTSPEWNRYIEEKMASRFHNNSINLQLDLLYEFCQWQLTRWHFRHQRHITLYRGINDFREHWLLHEESGRHAIVRLNNLVSFSTNRNIADEFGDYILEAQVPVVKIVFFNELLQQHPLKAEAEYLVLGGEYRVKVSYL
ncbi:NAD(+)--dinitrogen-reductase ADP-D-ribosyltransferase DraT [Methyloglobulus morosus KoM1]|uniref:NAD(+)--dinitrogen-reductase ADP-D-ribosyltransferase DraT n=1 Tax=Methyloglobulus morosus KoM1 TaxID=1116472 RepID=V5C4W6_9GAMM|nr:NAD(+)--dinitrogen-reductase ADP-D-ribosyltransferase [Methyloglobulus morosus]ESS73517.1 NAD(+)--dinitrogen-reductase ADP-D-ribosyltransferase DraT [Methyloglobulus morosus KoM1]